MAERSVGRAITLFALPHNLSYNTDLFSMRPEFYEPGSSGRMLRRLWLKRRQGDGPLATLLKRHTAIVQDHVRHYRPTDILAYLAGTAAEPLLDMASEMKRETMLMRWHVRTITRQIDKAIKEQRRKKQETMGRNIVMQLIVRQPGGAFRLWWRQRQRTKSAQKT